MLAAAIGNCLSASLAFCLRKSGVEVRGMHTEVDPMVERNEAGYLRVTRVDVRVTPTLGVEEAADDAKVNRCLDFFEKYCVVTGAVREGIDVNVKVNLSA